MVSCPLRPEEVLEEFNRTAYNGVCQLLAESFACQASISERAVFRDLVK
jgi:hypothetical protein